MGVEPYLVASSVDTIMAQRLVRVLCPACKEPDCSPEAGRLCQEWGVPADTTVYRAVGCPQCRQTGYQGRHAIFEMMTVTDDVRQLLLAHSSTGELRLAARRHGLRALREDGFRLVRQGVTTLEEIMRVTSDSDEAETEPALSTGGGG
jgi:type II secretory ATPase GspE/PulE/Tfp pilus assembly ATPase PilB-like protein